MVFTAELYNMERRVGKRFGISFLKTGTIKEILTGV